MGGERGRGGVRLAGRESPEAARSGSPGAVQSRSSHAVCLQHGVPPSSSGPSEGHFLGSCSFSDRRLPPGEVKSCPWSWVKYLARAGAVRPQGLVLQRWKDGVGSGFSHC